MKRLVGWIGATVGGITAYRLLKRRPEPAPEPEPTPAQDDDRADELRAKLAESRSGETAVEDVPAEPEAGEPRAVPEESPEDRRQRVHDEGRATLDEMKPE